MKNYSMLVPALFCLVTAGGCFLADQTERAYFAGAHQVLATFHRTEQEGDGDHTVDNTVVVLDGEDFERYVPDSVNGLRSGARLTVWFNPSDATDPVRLESNDFVRWSKIFLGTLGWVFLVLGLYSILAGTLWECRWFRFETIRRAHHPDGSATHDW